MAQLAADVTVSKLIVPPLAFHVFSSLLLHLILYNFDQLPTTPAISSFSSSITLNDGLSLVESFSVRYVR